MKDQIKAVVFDLGNVVFHCHFEAVVDHWAEAAKLTRAQVLAGLEAYGDEFHECFERGEMEAEEFYAHLSKAIGCALPHEEFETGWNNIYGAPCEGVADLILSLKKNYRVLALTNTNAVHAKVWPQRYEKELAGFERIFSSHEMRLRKPEPAIYARVLEYLQLRGEQVLFLDDREENIAGAARAGMRCITVRSPEQLLREVRSLGLV